MEDIRLLRAGVGRIAAIVCTIGLLLGVPLETHARVTRIALSPPVPAYSGATFGAVGQYEQIDGIAYGEIDPADPLNAVIQDIELAPRNARGMVDYSTKVSILKPVNISVGNHAMLLEIVNRGNKLNLTTFNVGASGTTAGDGFLETQGFTLAWVGWQADLTPLANLITMSAPIAHHRNGGTITGPVRSEFIIGASTTSTPQTLTTQHILAASSSNTAGYATASLDNSHDTLTMRQHQNDPRVLIPNSQWAYADCTTTPFPGVPDPQKVCLRGGFNSDHIYELLYTARDPIVMGLGLAAIRDVASFLRHASHDDVGTANPLAGQIRWSLLNGISQSGRLLRTFLELGFNRDEEFGKVFDGMQPHIGSVRNYINVRFSQPGRLAGTQHTEKQYPGPEGPLTYGRSFDPFTREEGGLLDRCEETRTCPKIIHTMSDIEYWESAGAFDTVDAAGTQDLDIPDNVRIYQFSSTQHGGFSPVAPLPIPGVTSTGVCQQLPNANSYTYNLRALLVALLNWVAKDIEPPPSRYSTLEKGTLVPPDEVAFPSIPNVTGPHGIWNTRLVYERGERYKAQDVSGVISIEPPIARAEYPTLLPQVDADGNDLDGLRSVTLMAPLGTYTGWNVRRAGFSQGDACDLTGGYVPFALTHAQRRASGDPRPSLQERYGDLTRYTAAAKAAAAHLTEHGYLLHSDEAAAVTSAVNQAQQAGLVLQSAGQ
ncbi:MAG TPA: alpha/beta hydrolase domain-containing protein [Burkholderiaceae bacterium]|nr:alpha/beta hydrolase domain-containing protein [Burkholderiaceae bacterium]